MNIEKIVDVAKALGWDANFTEQKNYRNGIDHIAEFSQFSPAGEDFSFDVFYTDAESLRTGIINYCMDFDIDEHITMWLDAKRNGYGGVPTARELVHDAEAIGKMLETFSDILRLGRC